jgi:CTP synthase (UTP-ammonia lyase)
MQGSPVRIGLIGDFDPHVTAHRAIPLALACASRDLGVAVHHTWLHTSTLGESPDLHEYRGLWCVPASPYADTNAALAAIRAAREGKIPFLGTCGGFQHAVLEYARDALRMHEAAHAELDAAAPDPLIAPLACSMVERSDDVEFVEGSRVAKAYGGVHAIEGYHCNYGLSARFERQVASGPLRVTGRDTKGDVRVLELDDHPFFVLTLFQSERRALRGETPPLVRAFVAAAMAR